MVPAPEGAGLFRRKDSRAVLQIFREPRTPPWIWAGCAATQGLTRWELWMAREANVAPVTDEAGPHCGN